MSLIRLTALNGNDLLIQSSAILYAERFAASAGRREPFTQVSIKDHPAVQVIEDIAHIVALIRRDALDASRPPVRVAAVQPAERIPA